MTSRKPLDSIKYPNIVVLERVFRGTPKLRDRMEASYETGSNHFVSYEFRGFGMPPMDVGHPGDVFWDVTYPYIIHVRGRERWAAWNPYASVGSQLLAEHPCFRDRYLWISPSGLAWYTQQGLNKAAMDHRQFHSLDDAARRALVVLLGAPTALALDVPENRARRDEEVARRGKLGIPVEAPPDVPVSAILRTKQASGQPEVKDSSSSISVQRPPSKSRRETNTEAPSEVGSLRRENARLKKLLEEAETEKRKLETQLTETEDKVKKLKKSAKNDEEELEELRHLKTRISDVLLGIKLPLPRT
ncbi:hypothetical protein B0H16DRAFT_1715651 [Mycena metata]|uniref:Uncharacterized protein n=1 Tax=Mycena metata TaxID=1033252 RepID=A0AAD7JTL4_9AGAR|nr:hypothetical protein B0H16DRAFT_1715651 [Mycena metata]